MYDVSAYLFLIAQQKYPYLLTYFITFIVQRSILDRFVTSVVTSALLAVPAGRLRLLLCVSVHCSD